MSDPAATGVADPRRGPARRAVPPSRACVLAYRLVLRQLTSPGRIVALTALSLVATVAGFALGRADDVDPTQAGAELMAGMGLAVVVPVVALVFAGASIGDLRDDKTLVYLWLRPMDRWPIVVGASSAALTISAPIALLPVVAGAALTGGGGGVVAGTAASAAVGMVAYTGVFTLFGVWLRRFIVWGLAYILIWEGFIAQAGNGVAAVAVRTYTRSILVAIADVDLDQADVATAAGFIVPLVAAVVALVLASWRLDTQDID
jgi:ABC-2 type transport system permease protein